VRLGVGTTVHDARADSDPIARVDRPAEQFRGRYQLQLSEGRKLLDA
jgi:hypothetical protein